MQSDFALTPPQTSRSAVGAVVSGLLALRLLLSPAQEILVGGGENGNSDGLILVLSLHLGFILDSVD